jgi:hypothetical protein
LILSAEDAIIHLMKFNQEKIIEPTIGSLYEISLWHAIYSKSKKPAIVLEANTTHIGLYLGNIVETSYYEFLIKNNIFLILPQEIKKEL